MLPVVVTLVDAATDIVPIEVVVVPEASVCHTHCGPPRLHPDLLPGSPRGNTAQYKSSGAKQSHEPRFQDANTTRCPMQNFLYARSEASVISGAPRLTCASHYCVSRQVHCVFAQKHAVRMGVGALREWETARLGA